MLLPRGAFVASVVLGSERLLPPVRFGVIAKVSVLGESVKAIPLLAGAVLAGVVVAVAVVVLFIWSEDVVTTGEVVCCANISLPCKERDIRSNTAYAETHFIRR